MEPINDGQLLKMTIELRKMAEQMNQKKSLFQILFSTPITKSKPMKE